MSTSTWLSIFAAILVTGLFWIIQAAQRSYGKNTRLIDRFNKRAQSCTQAELPVLMWEIMEYQSSQFLGHEQVTRVIVVMGFIQWRMQQQR